mgnify:FL=1|jgi:2-isopropylmalate synthase
MEKANPKDGVRKTIRIFDTTLRDGEQAPGASITPEEKVKIAMQIGKLGVDVIEPGFPIASEGEFRAVQEISRRLPHVEICGFARAVKEDIDRAIEATADAEKRRLHLFISSSDVHLNFQLKKTRDEVIRIAREMVAYAKQFVDRIEFSPMDATRTGLEFLMEMTEAVIEEGATIINIPDTVGYAYPEEFGAIFKALRENVRGGDRVEYSAHCHNDLGLAVANSLAAIQAGATQVEVTVNGIGERAGNCALEELVMALETRKETFGYTTNIRLEEIYETSRLVSRTMHFPIAYNKPIVGRNAFQHEAGIHQDGLLKNRSTYEIMNPDQLGVPRNMIVLGKHSGRHAIRHRVRQFGLELDGAQLDEVYYRFKKVADTQKTISDEQLAEIVGEATNRSLEVYMVKELEMLPRRDGKRIVRATVLNRNTQTEQTYTGSGNGAVEALVAALQKAIPLEIRFEDLELHSLSAGANAPGEAMVTVSIAGKSYRGSGIDEDVLMAVARAFVTACNQAMRTIGSQTG